MKHPKLTALLESKLTQRLNETAISPKAAKKLSIGDTVKTKKNTYKITGYGNKSNAFRQFEAEDAKGNKYNIQVSLRGNSDILVAPGRSLRFTEPGEMLESDAEYAKSLQTIARDKQLKMLSKKDKATLLKIAKLMKQHGITEASAVWKVFDAKQKLYGQAMDIETDMKTIAMDIEQTRKDMEQEAEPEGGKVANRYGKELDKLEKAYKKKKVELKKIFAKLEKLEMM